MILKRRSQQGSATQSANRPAMQAERAFTQSPQMLTFFLVRCSTTWLENNWHTGRIPTAGSLRYTRKEDHKRQHDKFLFTRTGTGSLGKDSLSGYVMAPRKWLDELLYNTPLINILLCELIHLDIEHWTFISGVWSTNQGSVIYSLKNSSYQNYPNYQPGHHQISRPTVGILNLTPKCVNILI